MLKKFLIGVVALAMLVFVVGLLLPGEWKIQASTTIHAPPARIYRDVATMSTWVSWTAWNREMDPFCKHSYSGPTTGVGSAWNFEGDLLGTGKRVITKGDPKTGIEYDVSLADFPTMKGAIELKAVDDGTEVVWKATGTSGGGVLMELMMNYANALGILEPSMQEEYESGLEKLKYRAESGSGGAPVDAAAKKK